MYPTLSSFRSDGFLPPTWTKKECSRERTLTLLPLNQEPSSIYCSQRKLLTLSRKITTTNKKMFLALLFLDFSDGLSTLYLQLCIGFAFVRISCGIFFFFPMMSFLIAVQERWEGKKNNNNWLVVCQRVRALQRLHSRDELWIALLWKRLLFVAVLWEVI